jgi:AraC-like DNA-binding protein
MEKITQILLYLGAVQGILFSLFLFSQKLNKSANKLLGGLTGLWGIFLFAYALQSEGLYSTFPHFLKVFYQFLFLFFPLLFLYIKYLLADIPKFEKKDYLHFLPFLISVILNMGFFIKSAQEKLYLINHRTDYYKTLQFISDEFISIQGIVYSILSLLLIKKYKKHIKDYGSNNQKIIRALYIGISLNLISWVIGSIGVQLEYFNIEAKPDFYTISYLVMVVVIYSISYYAIKSPEVFKIEKIKIYHKKDVNIIDNISAVLNSSEQNPVLEQKYSNTKKSTSSNISDLHKINEKLLEIMEREKPYLNPDLTLPELAKKLNVSRNQLSNVINQIHKVNFFQFVNRYRVKEIQRLMKDPANRNMKLLSLAFDSGFNSKASFNRIFKQITGMTPSEYFEQHSNNNEIATK